MDMTTTFAATRDINGVRINVGGPTENMMDTLRAHNFAPSSHIARTWTRLCKTPADLTVVQDALRGFAGR